MRIREMEHGRRPNEFETSAEETDDQVGSIFGPFQGLD